MSCQSNQIETVKYVYLACVDSNHTFVDSTDTELEISDPTLSNTFFQNLTDGQQYITKNNETFSSLYLRTFSNIEHFYKQKFFENFSFKKLNEGSYFNRTF